MQTMRESWTDERLDEFGKRMDERFDRVDERFNDVDKRLDRLANGLESVQKAIIFGAVTMSSVVAAGLIALISQS
jgi:predicted nuclease with TOPRIM domain